MNFCGKVLDMYNDMLEKEFMKNNFAVERNKCLNTDLQFLKNC